MSPETVQNAAPQGQVIAQSDGTLTYTHGQRYPDNIQQVVQTHRADGTLQSARVTWSGFAGQLLDISATFDAAGKLFKEEGYRAPSVKDPVSSFILPLPRTAPAPVVNVPKPSVSAQSELADLGNTDVLK